MEGGGGSEAQQMCVSIPTNAAGVAREKRSRAFVKRQPTDGVSSERTLPSLPPLGTQQEG